MLFKLRKFCFLIECVSGAYDVEKIRLNDQGSYKHKGNKRSHPTTKYILGSSCDDGVMSKLVKLMFCKGHMDLRGTDH